MAQYSYTKTAGNLLVPTTREARDFLQSKKIGSILYADFKQARNPAFHRKFFSLLNLGFEYWTPAGGAVSPFEIQFLRGYIKRLARYVDDVGVFHAVADEYLLLVGDKRAERLTVAKSFHAYRRWVTVEAGHFDLVLLPDGSVIKEPRSISFANMDELEFNDLYRSAINVLWNHILHKTFKSQLEAENVAAQLMEYAA
ncbi:TPA: DUF1367 family protein [Serratia marcescens]